MKKSIALLFVVMLIFSLAACGANKQNASSIPDTDRDQESTVTPTKKADQKIMLHPQAPIY